jgi:preprotein translocase subunit SecB
MNYKIIAKYIKDLKFNIPNPKIFFLIAENISNYKINIDIKSKQFKEKIVEIETSLTLNPTKNDFEKIEVEIKHSTIIELDGDFSNKQKLEQIILIEVPEKVYSEIRETFVFLFEKSGFKDIKIDKNVDFKKLYNQRKN